MGTAHRVVLGKTSDGKEISALVDSNGFLLSLVYGTYDGSTPTKLAVDANGKIENSATITAHVDELETKIDDQLKNYHPMGFDDSTTADTVYTFWEAKDGAWYIRRINTSNGTTDYAVGSSNLAAAIADPAGQSYDDFSAQF